MNDDCIVCTWPRITTWLPRGSFGRISSTSACTLRGDAGQVGALHADVDVDGGQDVVARRDGELPRGLHLDQVAEQLRAAAAAAAAAAGAAATGMLSSESSESTRTAASAPRSL